ncbi:hypothetical protein BCR41DRAFT_417737 [Lobosporangium transversale]|uniref:Uncharacterized protein n=1 Tax=Lobosporangium transversale TaxID=64571 RepID=A0A1Y2H213_9FUNG|nr:hypothetical protein BCR41DRAFT_417737 [Lobosporangium transversale]ORZ28586.1 hypothetical protein BCR41DRAFT_417737 [Lobosporangium transversale]|eukprot:XP_021886259.1 hypothetical protein BCR41DRAFT_417737 [Lobosporangium transversale]
MRTAISARYQNKNNQPQSRFYIPKRAKPNRYRPVFPTQKKELSPKKYDLTNCKQHDRPVSSSRQRKSPKKKEKEKKEDEKEEEVKEEKKKKKKNKGKAKYIRKTDKTRKVKEATAEDRRHGLSFLGLRLVVDNLLTTGPSNPADLPQLLDEVLDSRDFIYGLAALLYHGVMSPLSSKSSRMVMVPVQAALRSHYRNAQQNATAKKYLDFPTSAFSPRSLCLTEACLLDILWSNPTVREEIVQLLELNMSTKGAAEDKILNHKGILLQELFSLKGYKDVGLQSDDSPRRKLRTSSQAVQASSSAQQGSSSSGHGAGHGGDDGDDDGNEDDDILLGISDIDLLEVDEPFLDGDEGEEAAEEGTSSTNPLSPVSPSSRREINWKQRSRLLENVEVKYDTQAACPPPESTIIIGIDPGERYSMTIAKLDTRKPNEREILRISRASSSGAGTGSSSGVEASSSSGSETSDDNRETTYRALVDFYNDRWFVRNSWDNRKAQNGYVDYVIKAILKLAGGSNGRRRDANTNAVICIGRGSFKTNRGQVSKHGILMKKLVEKAKSLDYPIVGCHEYYTSAKCPRPHCDNAVDAENIARVCESQIREQKRPAKYMPPDGGTQGQASSGSGGGGGSGGSGGSGGGSSRPTKRKFSDEGGGGVEGSRPPKGPLLGPGGGGETSRQQQ